jgi:hypothetical protein
MGKTAFLLDQASQALRGNFTCQEACFTKIHPRHWFWRLVTVEKKERSMNQNIPDGASVLTGLPVLSISL